MSRAAASSSARLWWAAPSALAVVAALAFAVGFAPRLAQHVRVPAAISVGGSATGAGGPGMVSRSSTPQAGPTGAASPIPSRTPSGTQTEVGHPGTVVQPERPIVTSRPSGDDGGHDGGTSSGDAPAPDRSQGGTSSGDR